MNAVAKRTGFDLYESRCPKCNRNHVFKRVLDDTFVLGGDASDAFRIHDNGDAAALYPRFVCRNHKCTYEGTVVFAPAK